MKKSMAVLLAVAIMVLPVKSYAFTDAQSWRIIKHIVWVSKHHHHFGAGTYSKTMFSNGALGWEIGGGVMVALILDNATNWYNAKKNGTDADYQKAERFPQDFFDQLPGGTPGRLNIYTAPKVIHTGGYWEEKFNPDVISK